MGTVKFVFGLVCLAVAGFGGLPDRDLLGARDRVVAIAATQVGVREASGRNDGKEVEAYLAYVGLKKGEPYCAAWVSWVFGQAGYARPRTGWSPALFPASKVTKEVLPGNIMGIWFPSLNRIGHVGIVERKRKDWCQTLEANTNLEGGREGQGVYRRLRHQRTIHSYSNWLD
jgi:hypothetical protein